MNPDQGGLQQPQVTLVDRLTQAAATRMSRRWLFKSALIGGMSAAIGIPLFNPLTAAATNCHTCGAPCATCYSQTGSCCSPNGQYCRTAWCNCGDCGCLCFHASMTMCDNGNYANSCPDCCWGCAC
jgi:hypothetical protein